ncbi:hypothetical protein C8R43DRAFT_1105690 [Mycena crocata]|nr:hypothetical protein C8R43DRAFT_1105690 [Mycena crocata]
MTSEDTDALTLWTVYLQEYAKGHERPPPPPLKSSTKSASDLPSFDIPLYPPGEISRETAQIIAEFYDQYGFLPPPRADEETVRLRTIREYNLFRQDQIENFHRCSSLVNSFFQFAPVCTISLFHNDVQVVVSKAGDFPVKLGEGLVTETSICGHVVLKKNGQTTELHEISGDWRFAGNPWCAVDSNGIQGYVGVPITLEADPSNPQDSERVTVGVIALMSNRPFPKLIEMQRKVLDDLSSMLSVQLRSTWEGWRRGKEARLRNAVSLFLDKALVEPSQASMNTTVAMADPPVQGHEFPRRKLDVTSNLFSYAADQLQDLLEADFAIIVDLGAFHATKKTGYRQRSHSWLEEGPQSRASKWILGCSSSAACLDLRQKFHAPEAMASIASFLDMYAVVRRPLPPLSQRLYGGQTGRSVFSGSSGSSGLESLLAAGFVASSRPPELQRGSQSAAVPGSVPHLALPFYSANRPNLLIVVASVTPFFSFSPADVTFASNLGAVLIAHLAQNSIVEADTAKTAFVSQIRYATLLTVLLLRDLLFPCLLMNLGHLCTVFWMYPWHAGKWVCATARIEKSSRTPLVHPRVPNPAVSTRPRLPF